MIFIQVGRLKYFRFSDVGLLAESTKSVVGEQIQLDDGDSFCEPVLWRRWHHRGDFTSTKYSCGFDLIFNELFDLVARYRQMTWWGAQHARNFVTALNVIGKPACDLYDIKQSFATSLKPDDDLVSLFSGFARLQHIFAYEGNTVLHAVK